MGSLITSLSLHQIKWFWNTFGVECKVFPNETNFILIEHCFGKLLSINKVSSECESLAKIMYIKV